MVSAIGAADALNFSVPKKVDGDGGINLVRAAQTAGVQHFIMITSLGTGKFGWPAGDFPAVAVIGSGSRVDQMCTRPGLRVGVGRGSQLPGAAAAVVHYPQHVQLRANKRGSI